MVRGDQNIDLAYGLGVEALPNATTHRHARYALPPRPVTCRNEAPHSRARRRQSQLQRGAAVLREAVRRLSIAETIAGPLPDTRNPLLVTHAYADMVAARIMAIACDHEDAGDLAPLRHVIRRIRRDWPHVVILVRDDGHDCAPEVLDLMRRMRRDYILGLPTNRTLEAKAAPWSSVAGAGSPGLSACVDSVSSATQPVRGACKRRWSPALRRSRSAPTCAS